MFEKSKGNALFQQIFSYKDVSQSYTAVPEEHPFYSFYQKVQSCFDKLKKLDYEEMEIVTNDGATLVGYYFDNLSDRTFIGLHDYCANGIRQLSGEALYFYSKGYNVFIPFLRGHGKSNVQYTGLGLKEAEDVKQWIEKISKKRENMEFVIEGIGVGGAIAAIVSTLNIPSVKKLILDSPAYSITTLVEEWVTLLFGVEKGSKKFDLIVNQVKDIYKDIFGVDYSNYDFNKIIREINIPTLMFLETDDNYYQGLVSLTNLNEKVKVKTICSATRNEGFYAYDSDYLEVLNLFIN